MADEPQADKNQAAVEMGRRGGRKGGAARAAKMTPEQRSASSRLAAQRRWAKSPTETTRPVIEEVSAEDVPVTATGIKEMTQEEIDLLPFAKWRGIIDLGGNEIDCYVLNDETRVLSSGSTTKAIASVERGSLQDYIGQKALNSFIDKDKVLQETIRFSIPGTQWVAIGITTEHFELICRGYVRALYEGAALTGRQREIAIRCAMLTAALTRTGLDALVDEATGYQYERAEDALQVKLRAFIADELRAWEKTFPDDLWEEFGRLTGWKTPLQSRPKWWGKLVTELIYDTLDPDVAAYLKANKPPSNVRWHQQLTENHGTRQLVSRCYEVIGMAKTCDDMHELRQRVAHHYGKKPVQITMFLKPGADQS